MTKLYPRLSTAPDQSFFLLGARGTGKSTWISQAWKDAHRVDLLDEALYQAYLARPETFAEELRAQGTGRRVVVDEIQRLPELLHTVHRFIEEHRQRFLLCGSSARKLKREGTNLLAGRALRREMYPFVPEELGRDFSVERALAFGTLPVIWASTSPGEALSAYALMYLRHEIQAEALVRNLPGFARFLPIMAVMHGQVLNASTVARDAGVARTTVLGYLQVLEDTHVAFGLPAYEARLRVRERKHPKFYLFDPGVVRALKGPVAQHPAPEEKGALFEGWLAGLLRAYGHYRRLFEDWAYWAPLDAKATEVDFLLRRGGEHLAIEAKYTRTPGAKDLHGLKAIADLRGVARRMLVCRCERPRRTDDGIDVLPVERFLAELADGKLWP